MSERPGLFTRVIAGFKSEVPADTLESVQKAGIGVYQVLDDVELLRKSLAAQGADPWSVPEAVSAQQLYAWNAFVLQTLGDKMIEADYRADALTVGYLPRVTAEQVWAFFGQVEGWLSLARQAAANPGFTIGDRRSLPADLPGWVEVEPCPRPHLEAMIAAGAAIREHAELALALLEAAGVPHGRQADLHRLRQIAAEAATAADYATNMYSPRAEARLHELIEERLRHALEAYHHLGQLVAMPSLLKTYGKPGTSGSAGFGESRKKLPRPGQAGFDPWCLTQPRSVSRWKNDLRARESITEMWRHDPNPAQTLRFQEDINACLERGYIAPTGAHYYCCPWAPIFRVNRPVLIGDRRLQPGQEFTLEVSAEEILETGRFVREIVNGPFHPTNQIDYCNPGDFHDD
ncbi:hypothetical protein N5079_26340 [Planotetraspora sp. A-T 1434]|uniref:hypothetical protein n=1 Tax=Planotetraspora sp. A-T 1434 TaxID=2979219 RepID=UPI0021BFDBE2|nr:hypothetical protein [Planotetraspora sp. A-T 1434]MCT9933738.1 hypothetical protein [Planotetraspora sp. A-T 1434]